MHFWETEKSVYSEKLILDGTMHVRGGRIGFDGKLRRVSDGLTVRTLDRQVRFDELPHLRETVLTDIVSMTGQSVAEPVLARWRSLGASDSESFLAYLKGLAHLDRAKKADQENHWKNAEAEFDRVLGAGLGFALAAVGLGDAYREGFRVTSDRSRADKAERYYRQAHSADKLAALHSGRGLLDILRGDRLSAVESLKAALRIDPYDFKTRETLAATLKAIGRLGDAEQVMNDGKKEQPQCWFMSNTLSLFHFRDGRYQEAEQELLRLIEISSRNMAAYANLARVYFVIGQYEEAVDKGLHALALRLHPQTHSTVGQAYIFAGCREQGLEHLRHSVETQEANRYVFWLNLAETLRFLPGLEAEAEYAAQDSVREARAIHNAKPNDGGALRHLARGLAWLGDRDGALDALDKLERVETGSAARHETVAVVHELLGNRAQALNALDKALAGGLTAYQIRQNSAFLDLVRTPQLSLLLQRHDRDPFVASQELFGAPCVAP